MQIYSLEKMFEEIVNDEHQVKAITHMAYGKVS